MRGGGARPGRRRLRLRLRQRRPLQGFLARARGQGARGVRFLQEVQVHDRGPAGDRLPGRLGGSAHQRGRRAVDQRQPGRLAAVVLVTGRPTSRSISRGEEGARGDGSRRSPLRRPRRVRLQAGARPQHRKVRQLRRRHQLHLDPHRRLPALLLRLRVRRTGLLVDLADGLRRPADGGADLRRAGRQLPGGGVDLQLGQALGHRDRRLAGRLDDAHGVDRDARRRRPRLPVHPAPDLVGVPVRRRRHRQVRLRRQRRAPRPRC